MFLCTEIDINYKKLLYNLEHDILNPRFTSFSFFYTKKNQGNRKRVGYNNVSDVTILHQDFSLLFLLVGVRGFWLPLGVSYYEQLLPFK